MRSFFTFLILSFLLLALDSLGWMRSVRGMVEKGTNPLKGGIYRTISNVKYQVSNIKYSREELIALKEKVEELEREVAKLKIENSQLKIDNQAMRRLLQAPLPPEWKFLPAKTLGGTRYLTIDKGKRDGVKKGMVVVFEEVLVGRVVGVSEKSAKIMLPTDPESKIAVKVGNVRGILLGESDRLILTEVLQGRKIKVDGLVVTSGENEVFPANLLIGKVSKIEKEERQPYQKAEVEPLIEYNKLETVFLIVE